MTGKDLMTAVLVASAVVLATPQASRSWAQTATPPDRSTDIPEELGTMPEASPRTPSLDVGRLSAGELRDKDVYDRTNEKVATIHDVTGSLGQPRQAILRMGGLMGFGGRDVAVPLDKLSVGENGHLVLNMTEDQLKLLPKIN